jgi:hypothetical protein
MDGMAPIQSIKSKINANNPKNVKNVKNIKNVKNVKIKLKLIPLETSTELGTNSKTGAELRGVG